MGLFSEQEWQRAIQIATKRGTGNKQHIVPATYEVYRVKKLLTGLVFGGLDKNLGETWGMCPALYDKALGSTFKPDTGYDPIYPWKCTQHQRKKLDVPSLVQHVCNPRRPPSRSKGNEKDILQAWKLQYTKNNWKRFGVFGTRGGFNVPYILPKAKNVIQPEIRREKWMKVRPIAPSTKHPLRQVLHKAGRAWFHISRNIPGDHFVLDKCDDVPMKLKSAVACLQHIQGGLHITNEDIEGCYPNMPKELIKEAARWVCNNLELAGKIGVWVPRRGKKKCSFDIHPNIAWKYTWLPFADLIDIMEFSLDNAIIRLPDGMLCKQKEGVPMGDAISPGGTIITLAYMENTFLSRLQQKERGHVVGIRYMDDLLTVYKDDGGHQTRDILTRMHSSMYKGRLRLEPAHDSHFLETRFELRGDKVLLRLKNENEGQTQPKVWRYQHWYSATSFTLKRSILLAALKKVHFMASDHEQLAISARAKVQEFMNAGYPFGVIKFMCSSMATTTGERVWLDFPYFSTTCTTNPFVVERSQGR